MEFIGFNKIARLSRECVITEKIDGTNGQICIGEDGEFMVGSRNRWLDSTHDNAGFFKWAVENQKELMRLGPGRHFGEWWGRGIQRGYNQIERKFSLFNTARWSADENLPDCCEVVPVICTGIFNSVLIDTALDVLRKGSLAAPGYPFPEGIVIYHKASNSLFKKTLENDEAPKIFSKNEVVL